MALNGWLARLTPFDRGLVLLLALLVGLSFLLPFGSRAGSRVLVSQDGRTVFSAPLNQQRQVEIEGPLGITRLSIADGAARVISSPCPQKICIGLGEARHGGDLLACVPNRVVVRIAGDAAAEEQSYDLLSR